MFADRLIETIIKKNNPTVMGMDPKLDYIPREIVKYSFENYGETFRGAGKAIIEFNKRLLDATYDLIPAIKPQLAYYEMYGTEGIKAFEETIKYAKKLGLLIIADAKRNDIGSSAEAYSAGYLGSTKLSELKTELAFNVDALTVNPYFGIDGIQPFIEDCINNGKGIYILVKTSNKSSGDFQDIKTESGEMLYEIVAKKVNEWGKQVIGKSGYSSIGAVVGATYPIEAKKLREIMKDNLFLVPGYGAQGGGAKDVSDTFGRDGLGAIVNSSRGIMCAYKSEMWKKEYSPKSFDKAARAEVIRMKDDINKYRTGAYSRGWEE
jgi:orotidine-5'-phosphate decarboxylase